jgi:hypothetical protein
MSKDAKSKDAGASKDARHFLKHPAAMSAQNSA